MDYCFHLPAYLDTQLIYFIMEVPNESVFSNSETMDLIVFSKFLFFLGFFLVILAWGSALEAQKMEILPTQPDFCRGMHVGIHLQPIHYHNSQYQSTIAISWRLMPRGNHSGRRGTSSLWITMVSSYLKMHSWRRSMACRHGLLKYSLIYTVFNNCHCFFANIHIYYCGITSNLP